MVLIESSSRSEAAKGSAQREQIQSREALEVIIERDELGAGRQCEGSQVAVGPLPVRRSGRVSESPKLNLQVGWLRYKHHPRVAGQLFIGSPRVLLALNKLAHDLGVRQVPQKSHLRNAAEGARVVLLRVKPSLGRRVLCVVRKSERKPHVSVWQLNHPRGWYR